MNTELLKIKNNRENIIRTLVIIIVLSCVCFIFGLYNYIMIQLNDPYIPSNGGGDVIGTITSTPDVGAYGETYVSYNINNKSYTKTIRTYSNSNYKLNSKIDLLYDKNHDVIDKSKKNHLNYTKMMNDFYSVTLMQLGFIIFIIFSIVYFFFTKYIKF